MFCFVALIVFAVLGIFSAKYRDYAKEAFSCVFRRATLRPCNTDLNVRIKNKMVSKLMRLPKTAKFVHKNYEAIEWIFTITLIVSLAFSVQAGYNLYVHGTCTPDNPDACMFSVDDTCVDEYPGDIVVQDQISSFSEVDTDICTVDGKPIIRMYSIVSCSHCNWVGQTFDKVVKEYVDSGDIVAYHWQLDMQDDILTSEAENAVPEEEKDVFLKYSPQGGVPLFVFGCKYYRIGNAYEGQGDLMAEENEFRAVIEKLIE